jgi:HEAT repeat protein
MSLCRSRAFVGKESSMISKRVLGAIALFATAFLAVGILPRAASEDKPAIKLSMVPNAPSAPAAGRFQLTTASGQLFLLDTTTGQVWKHTPNGKTDEHFFDPKIKDDPLANLSDKLGPTYQGIPLSYWMVTLRDGDAEFRSKGIEAIGYLGPQASAAVPVLVELLIKSATRSQWLDNSDALIGWAIAQIDPRHDSLRSLLQHKQYEVRRNAALTISALGNIDPKQAPGRALGTTQLYGSVSGEPADETERDDSPKWQLPKDTEAIPVLIEMLQDRQELGEDVTYAEVALICLKGFGKEAKAAVPTVTRMLADKNASIRQKATTTLAQIGPAAKDTIPSIRAKLKDADTSVRAAAVEALGKLDDRDSLAALKTLMQDKDAGVRSRVVETFGRWKEDAKETVPLLLEVMKTPASKLQTTIQREGKEMVVEDGLEIAVVGEAFKALGKLGPTAKAAVPELIEQAQLPKSQFAWPAYRALKKIAPDEAAKIAPPQR